jgi:hypothetical protein
MKILSLIFLFASLPAWQLHALTIAQNKIARVVIVTDPDATPTENFAARELASNLAKITGASFEIRTHSEAPAMAIIVGPGAAARKLFKDVPLEMLGGEELVMRTDEGHLLLAGGRPRGTLYAVSRFLQEQCGARWWTPWAASMPSQPTLQVKDLNIREKPAFEYREPYWFTTKDTDWSWRNFCNGNFCAIPFDQGGHIAYQGFVHTFYPLVPPEKYFASHPEWYSLVDGKRVDRDAQLCLTNPKLRQFVVERVKEQLRASPDANIISVSQNDCAGACQCDNCRALDEREGSHAGTMLDFVNYVAGQIEPAFPDAAVDTLAYQYTRKPPRTLHPRPNVIVRLCSIECNFGAPMDDPSNASFAGDIRGWAERADRLYIWDYVTDFAHYVQPFPNWFVLGPNLRFFQAHHVRGVFEEGAYQSYGSEMAEMRAWVLAQLLWNPQQDDRALIREFLDGYYGTAAGSLIWRYLELLQAASRNYNLTCYSPPDAPFLRCKTLAEAELLWQEAERAVAGNDDLLARVRLGHLPVRYVWLARWDDLRKECAGAQSQWPLPEAKQEVVAQWRDVAKGVAGKPWTKVTQINEGGLTPESFLARFRER